MTDQAEVHTQEDRHTPRIRTDESLPVLCSVCHMQWC